MQIANNSNQLFFVTFFVWHELDINPTNKNKRCLNNGNDGMYFEVPYFTIYVFIIIKITNDNITLKSDRTWK